MAGRQVAELGMEVSVLTQRLVQLRSLMPAIDLLNVLEQCPQLLLNQPKVNTPW